MADWCSLQSTAWKLYGQPSLHSNSVIRCGRRYTQLVSILVHTLCFIYKVFFLSQDGGNIWPLFWSPSTSCKRFWQLDLHLQGKKTASSSFLSLFDLIIRAEFLQNSTEQHEAWTKLLLDRLLISAITAFVYSDYSNNGFIFFIEKVCTLTETHLLFVTNLSQLRIFFIRTTKERFVFMGWMQCLSKKLKLHYRH